MLKLWKSLIIGADVGLVAYLIYAFLFIDMGHYTTQVIDVLFMVWLLVIIGTALKIKTP